MNRGFSIVQVLVSIGLLGIIAISGIKIFETQTKLGKSSSFLFESLIVLDEVKSLLSDGASCRHSLKGKSTFYDDLEVLYRFDPKTNMEQVEFEVFNKDKGRVQLYGQNEVRIGSISIHGDQSGFGNEKDYIILRLNFQESGGGETFKGEFPLRVSVNELGRIEACKAQPGLHSGGISRVGKSPWLHIQKLSGDDDKKKIFYEDKVNIGKVETKGLLNVEGGVLVVLDEILQGCTSENEGELVFEKKRDSLFWCDGSFWSNISYEKKSEVRPTRFVLQGKGSQLKSKKLESTFSYCALEKIRGNRGECRAQFVNKSAAKNHWELLLKGAPGVAIDCSFLCYQ